MKKGITIIGFLLIALVSGCALFDDMCATQLYNTIPSPNGELKAVVYQRDCGATTSFTTNILIMESDDPLQTESGNIYRRRGHPVNFAPLLYWQSDNELVIVEKSPDESYENAQSWESPRSKVTISYSDSPPPGLTATLPTPTPFTLPLTPPALPTGSLPAAPAGPPTPYSTPPGQ